MTTKSNDHIVTVVTCEGNLQDPTFPLQLQGLVNGLKRLLGTSAKHKAFRVTKLEPWNSVRVTFQIPREAAQRLRQLAQQGDRVLRELGILSVQIEGDQVISLTIAGRYSQPQEIVLTTESDGRANSGTPSLDLSGSEGSPGPSNVETTRKNIAQYLSQQGATAAVATMTVVGSAAPPAVASTSSAAGSSSDFFHGASNASSQFKSPNVVAPGGEPIPFPARQGAVPSRTPGAFGPFPFASMTHAAINTMHGSHHQGQTTPSTAASTSPAPTPSPSPSASGMSPRFPFSSPPPPYPGSSAASTPSSVGLNPLHQPQPPPTMGIPAAGHQPLTGSYGQPPTSSATVNNLARGGSGPNVALSSPLLVNLLQSDLAGSAPPSQHLSKLFPHPVGHPHQQDGAPVKRKRKPRRPKDRPGEVLPPSSASPAASPLMSPLSPATLSLPPTTTATPMADLGFGLSSSQPAFSISLPVLPSIPLSPPVASPVSSVVSAPQTATTASNDGSSQEKELSPWPSPSKRTQHLINPFTGQLEPMPTDDEDEDETPNNLVLEDTNSNPSEKETSTTGDVEKASERLNVPSESTKEAVGKVVIPIVKEEPNPVVTMKDSPPSGVGSPGEKIKLRLKLEPKGREVSKDSKEKESNVDRFTGRSAVYVEKQKADNMSAGTVQYKVDVSFVNIPTVKKTSAAGSGFGGSSTPTTSTSEPRVPPLHISLRGRNAMVVGSLRKEEKGTPQLHSKDAHTSSETDAGRRLEANVVPVSMRSQRSKSPRNSRLSESGVGRRGSAKTEGGRRNRGLVNIPSNPLSSVPSAAISTTAVEPTVTSSVTETSSDANSSPPPAVASKDGERGTTPASVALAGFREKALLSGGGIVLASLRGSAVSAAATTTVTSSASTTPTKVTATAQVSTEPTTCTTIHSNRGESESANTKLAETAESKLFKEVHRTVEPVVASATNNENVKPPAEGKVGPTAKVVAECSAETVLPSSASLKETSRSVSSAVDSVMHVKGVSVVRVDPQPVTMEAVVVVKPCGEVSSAIMSEGNVPSSVRREDGSNTPASQVEASESPSLPIERREGTSSEGDPLTGENVKISSDAGRSSSPSKLDAEISEPLPSRLPLPPASTTAAAPSLPYSAQVSFLRVACSRDGAIAKQSETAVGTSSVVPQNVAATPASDARESRQSNAPVAPCSSSSSSRTIVPVVGESRWSDALTNSETPSTVQESNMQRQKSVADSTTPVRKGASTVLPVTPESLQRLRTVTSSALAGVRSSSLALRQLCAPTPVLETNTAVEPLQLVALVDSEESRITDSSQDAGGTTVVRRDASADVSVVGACVVTPTEKSSPLVADERTLESAIVSTTSANHHPTTDEVSEIPPVQRVCRDRQKEFIPNVVADEIASLENSWHDGQLPNAHRKLSNHSSLETESHADSPLPPSPLLETPTSPPLTASTKVVEVPSLEVDPAFSKVKMASPAVTSGFPSLIPSHGDRVVVHHIDSLEEMDQSTEAEFLGRATPAVTGKGMRLPAAGVHLNSTLRTLSSNTAAAVCNFVVPASAGANTVYRNHASHETLVSITSLMKGEGDSGCAATGGSHAGYGVDRYAMALRDDRTLGTSKDSSSSSSGSSPNEDSGIDSMDALSEKQSESEVESSRNREDRLTTVTEQPTSTICTNTAATVSSAGPGAVAVCPDQLSQLHRTAATPPNLPSPIGGGGDGGGNKDADEDDDASTRNLTEDVIISVQLEEGEDGESSHVYLVESSGEPCLEEHVSIDGETSTMHIYVATDAEDASRAEQLISNLEGVEGPVTAVVLAESSFTDGEASGLFETHIATDDFTSVVSNSADEVSVNDDGRKPELLGEEDNDHLNKETYEKCDSAVEPCVDIEEAQGNNDNAVQVEPADSEGNDHLESTEEVKVSESNLLIEGDQKLEMSSAMERDGMVRSSIISGGPSVDTTTTQPAIERSASVQVALPATSSSSLPPDRTVHTSQVVSQGATPTSHLVAQGGTPTSNVVSQGVTPSHMVPQGMTPTSRMGSLGVTPTTTMLESSSVLQALPRTIPNSFVTSASNPIHSSFVSRSLASSSSSVQATYTSCVSTMSMSSMPLASSPGTVPIKLVTLPTLVSPSVRLSPGIPIPSDRLSPPARLSSPPSTSPPMKLVSSSPVVPMGSVVVKSVVVTNTSASLKTVHPQAAIETVSISSNLSSRLSPLTTAGTTVLRIEQPSSPNSVTRILPSSDDYVSFPGVKSIQLPSPIQHTCFVTREPVKTSMATVTTTSDPVVTMAGPNLLVTSSSGLSSASLTSSSSASIPLLSRWNVGSHASTLPLNSLPISNGSPGSLMSHVSSLTGSLSPEIDEKALLMTDTVPPMHHSKGTTSSIGSYSPPSDDLLSPPPDVSPSDGESYFSNDRDHLLESSVATGDHNYVYRVMRPVELQRSTRTETPLGNHHETDSSREALEGGVSSASPASYDLKLECPEDVLSSENYGRESVAEKPDDETLTLSDAPVIEQHPENGDLASTPQASVVSATDEESLSVKIETPTSYDRPAIDKEDLEVIKEGQIDLEDHEISLRGMNADNTGLDSTMSKNENLTSNAHLLDSPNSAEPEERRWMRSMRSSVKHAPLSPCKIDGPQDNHVTASDDDTSTLVNSDNHNDPANMNAVDHSVPSTVVNSIGGSRGCKRRREDSGSDAERRRDSIGVDDGDENAHQPKSPSDNENLTVPFYTKPVKRRCSENAAELIKACMGVEDTPKRASITKHRSSSTEDSCTPPEKGRTNDSRSSKTEDEMAKGTNRYYKGRREDGRRGRAGSQVSMGMSGESSDDELTLSEIASKNKVSKQARRPPTPVADDKNATRHSKQRHKGQDEDVRRVDSHPPVANSRHNSRGRDESSKGAGRGLRESRRDLRRGTNHPAGTHSSAVGQEELNMRDEKVSSQHLTRGSRSSERSRRSPPRARDKSPVRGGHSRGRGKDNDRSSSPIHHGREDETATKRKTRSSGTSGNEYYDSLPQKRRRYSRDHR